MIVPQGLSSNSGPPKSAAAMEKIVPDVAPPAYDSAPSSIVPQHIKPANYISLKARFSEVKDTFVLDPTLRIPHSMQPRNKKLHFNLKTRMGEAHAVVYIVPSQAQPQGKTRIEVSSRMGTAYLELHATEVRAPLSIKMSSRLGEATLLLPRSFRGPLRISTRLGDATLSAGLRSSSTIFGDGRVFVGEWRKDEEEKRGWDGDEAFVDSKLGTVRIQYNDEAKV